jgi:cytoskeletal protein CcmA (bactofilin family)
VSSAEVTMREERGQIQGDQVIAEAIDLWGSILGDVTVVEGGKMYVRGAIYGNLTVADGGRVHIYGNVTGNLLVKEGAKVIHSGVIGGEAVNRGGRLFVEDCARIIGKLRTKSGQTSVEPGAQVRQ